MKTENQESLNPAELGNKSKQMLCAGLNDKQTTRIERTLFDIFNKYNLSPSIQNKLAVEILKACDDELENR
jgi:hypothetical protein